MSSENNDLFEGLQIMTASEMNNAVQKNEEGEDINKDGEPEFTLSPVAEITDKKESEVITTENSNPNEDKNEVVLKALMKTLMDADVLPQMDEEEFKNLEGKVDVLKGLIEKTLETQLTSKQDNWKKNLSSEKKRFLELEDAFDSTDHAILMAQRLEVLETITEESLKDNVQLQKQLYFEDLKAKGFSDEDAKEELADAEAAGKLHTKSWKAVPNLQKQANDIIDNNRATKLKDEEEQKEIIKDSFTKLMDNIEKRESFIEGLNLNKTSKDKLKANITNVVHKDENREYNSLMYKQMKNPLEFDMLINYYDTLGLFNIDKDGNFKPDISKIKAIAKTAAITELDKVIASENERGAARNTSVETSDKTSNIIKILEAGLKK
jgi:hypothetical protein